MWNAPTHQSSPMQGINKKIYMTSKNRGNQLYLQGSLFSNDTLNNLLNDKPQKGSPICKWVPQLEHVYQHAEVQGVPITFLPVQAMKRHTFQSQASSEQQNALTHCSRASPIHCPHNHHFSRQQKTVQYNVVQQIAFKAWWPWLVPGVCMWKHGLQA